MRQEDIDSYLLDPRESLDTELKAWIDPTSDSGIVKIAKAAIALFNNNGGRLIVGFKDDGTPDQDNRPHDVRKQFSADVIQGIVARFASRPFEVNVVFGRRDSHEYPIILVPSGVETPVAAKRDFTAADRSNIKPDTLYVRTLNSNNTVSSSQARAADWERLVKICFENREADIGAFFRRHIGQLEDLGFFGNGRRGLPSMQDQVGEFLDVGQQHFRRALERQKLVLPSKMGTREAAFIIFGEAPPYSLNEEFLWKLESRKPNHTGWTPWILTGDRLNDPTNPYIIDDGYERLMWDLEGRSGFTFGDFWRIERGGRFYHLRVNEDDTPAMLGQYKPEPGTQLDFLLQISRAAEIVSIALAFARALEFEDAEASVGFAFRWSGLAGRHLTSWVEPGRSLRGGGPSQQDTLTTHCVVSLETPPTAIAPQVEKLVAPLFALFGGKVLDRSVFEGIVANTLGRRY